MNEHPGRAGALGANWSVAMEEQFYLFWPPVLAWLYRRVRSERLIAGFAVNQITYRAIEAPMRRRGSHPSTVLAGRVAP